MRTAPGGGQITLLAESADWDRAFTALNLRYEGDVRVSAVARTLHTKVEGVPVRVRLRREQPHWISVTVDLSEPLSGGFSLHPRDFPGSVPVQTDDLVLADRIGVKGIPSPDLVARLCQDHLRGPLLQVLMSSPGSRLGPDAIEMFVEGDSRRAGTAIADVLALREAWAASPSPSEASA